MNSYFDQQADRTGRYSMKFDPSPRGKPADVLPMWVADMDFAAPPCVREAVAEYGGFGIFGYSEPDAAFFEVLQSWFERRHGWRIAREWTVMTPGVVNALYVGVRAFTREGDGVVIQQPVYYPFECAIRDTRRTLLVNPLVYENGQYTIDFDDFEEKIKQAKLFILCSPHNPAGRVWTQAELERMGEICLRHKVTVIADEIWQDLVYPPYKNIVFASIAPELAEITVTATAPSKTFNLAGLQLANIFASNKELHRQFKQSFNDLGLHQPSLMGLVSCRAAYEHGEEWLAALLDYLAGNFAYLRDYLTRHVPGIKLVEAQGTYLAWLNCMEWCERLNIPQGQLDEVMTRKAKLWLSDGRAFGVGGEGFMRMNAACPREVLGEALGRIKGRS
jgi:cystathionine beta-lyase